MSSAVVLATYMQPRPDCPTWSPDIPPAPVTEGGRSMTSQHDCPFRCSRLARKPAASRMKAGKVWVKGRRQRSRGPACMDR